MRLSILDLLLENMEQRGPNLAHLLLGLASSPRSSSAVDAAEPFPEACLDAVVGLLRNPVVMEQEPRLTEKW